jgi:hypothetical protein
MTHLLHLFTFSGLKLGVVARACNPSFSGDRDQEAGGLKPDRATSW